MVTSLKLYTVELSCLCKWVSFKLILEVIDKIKKGAHKFTVVKEMELYFINRLKMNINLEIFCKTLMS